MGFLIFFTCLISIRDLKNIKPPPAPFCWMCVRPEYREGHIPDSRNIPLQSLEQIGKTVRDKNIPVYVYCYSGGRSRQAVKLLTKMGYSNVKNLGGIASYSGKVVH